MSNNDLVNIERQKKVLVDLMNDKFYVPMKIKELAVILNVPKERRPELEAVLSELLAEGKISLSKRGKYSISKEKRYTGIFTSHEKGFGFVTVEGIEEDFFIPATKVNGAFHKDTVEIIVDPVPTGKRKEGRVVRVVSHEITQVIGYFQKNKTFGYVVPDNTRIAEDIYIPGKFTKGAMTGHKVVVEITNYGTNDRKPEGRVTEIIGHVNDPGVDIMSVILAYDIPTEFPVDVMEEVESVPDEVPEKDKEGRLDLRDWTTVTIDGDDAKDLDDAITLFKEGNNYKLGVHIADVSNYVKEGSPLDKEALKRGTSVYLVDRVIPMLPHKLSNGLCSLNEGVDRLALSCIMDVDPKGNIIGHQIAETVIRSNRRMTYSKVRDILVDHDESAVAEYKELVPMFELMKELSEILRNKRENRGAIDFDFPECKIKLDEKGKPVEIKPYDRNVATRIIEDFMLAANETVAEDFFWQELPFVYRNHEKPEKDKMNKLAAFVSTFGYTMRNSNGEVHPKEVQKLLSSIEGKPEEDLIARITLRSMQRASYTPECLGHFGLSAKYYSHFTSPIRRYPDLQIHRIIKEQLNGKLNSKRIDHYKNILGDVTKVCSTYERRADDAERDVDKLKKVEYMKNYIGEEFEGVISGITNYGIYVELPNTVEGMIHVNNMRDDHYNFVEDTYSMVGERTGRTYKLGESVRIVVDRCDKVTKTIDFLFA
ncbi:MAG: ribonuclease R [Lachnospiraceae bacterium]|nr:ribonuclease R [Lachnospiraceae bacterium]